MSLVLARHINESINIGDNIRVTVVQIGNERVRLSVDAPKDVLILRGELDDDQQKRERENE